MNNWNSVLWIGGDKRQIMAENVMYCLGWDTSVCLFEDNNTAKGVFYADWRSAFTKRNVLIFPLPMTVDGVFLNAKSAVLLSDMIDAIGNDSLVLGGKMPLEIQEKLRKKGIAFVDYYDDAFQTRNALPTAEGAIALALSDMPRILSDSRALVVGFGRIGKILSYKLHQLNANVTVAARKPSDIAMAESCGCSAFSMQKGIEAGQLENSFDVIFNTVPVCLFQREQLAAIKPNTLFIDLASSPGGIAKEEADRFGIRVITAQSLPGKFSPVTAGKILAETIVRILTKEDNLP